MSMKRALFSSNEIILTADQNEQGEFPVTNLDVMSKGIFEGNLIVTGLVVSEQSVPDMSVQVSVGFANDSTVEQFLVGEAATSLTIQPADASLVRRDVIEMRRVTEDIEPESRNFKDPNTGAISTATIDTVQEYKTEYKVLTGTPGSNALPVETNWIKIAEIEVPASASSITDTDIKNVDARAEGDINTGWTNSTTATFRAGSIKDIKDKIAPKLSIISNGSTTTPGTRDLSLIANVSGADGTFTINPPVYLGQRSTLSVSGSNIATFVVNGLDIQMESGDVVDLFTVPSGSSFIWGWEKLPEKKITVSDLDTITPSVQNLSIVGDITSGDATITLNTPPVSSIGREGIITANGSGILNINGGSGIYVNGIKITDGLEAKYKIVSDGASGAIYQFNSEVSADYVSATYRIQQSASGFMRVSEEVNFTTSILRVSPVPFVSTGYRGRTTPKDAAPRITGYTISTTTNFSIVGYDSSGVGTNVTVSYVMEGDY